jgi:hypothetical protein
MIDKSKQMVGLKWHDWISRQWVEKTYPTQFTDEQWEIFVDYCDRATTEEEFDEDFAYAVNNFRELEENLKLYSEVWLEENGNPYPFDKDGNNVEEDN